MIDHLQAANKNLEMHKYEILFIFCTRIEGELFQVSFFGAVNLSRTVTYCVSFAGLSGINSEYLSFQFVVTRCDC